MSVDSYTISEILTKLVVSGGKNYRLSVSQNSSLKIVTEVNRCIEIFIKWLDIASTSSSMIDDIKDSDLNQALRLNIKNSNNPSLYSIFPSIIEITATTQSKSEKRSCCSILIENFSPEQIMCGIYELSLSRENSALSNIKVYNLFIYLKNTDPNLRKVISEYDVEDIEMPDIPKDNESDYEKPDFENLEVSKKSKGNSIKQKNKKIKNKPKSQSSLPADPSAAPLTAKDFQSAMTNVVGALTQRVDERIDQALAQSQHRLGRHKQADSNGNYLPSHLSNEPHRLKNANKSHFDDYRETDIKNIEEEGFVGEFETNDIDAIGNPKVPIEEAVSILFQVSTFEADEILQIHYRFDETISQLRERYSIHFLTLTEETIEKYQKNRKSDGIIGRVKRATSTTPKEVSAMWKSYRVARQAHRTLINAIETYQMEKSVNKRAEGVITELYKLRELHRDLSDGEDAMTDRRIFDTLRRRENMAEKVGL